MSQSATRAGVLPAVGVAALSVLLLAPGADAAWTPDFEAPFLCGQDWQAESRPDHSPSRLAVDFNRDDDFRAPVRATAPGRVSVVADVGSTSYGKYLRIEHGRGWESLYAHLDAQFVVVGQWVDQGTIIGLLGTSGGSSGPHLHFEQKLDGTVKHAVFHSDALVYNTTIDSYNCGDVPIAGNWNGDRRTDVGVFRPRPGGNVFRLLGRDRNVTVVRFGVPGDLPLTGDWNGNGTTDVGVWNRLTRTFDLRLEGGNTRSIKMGKVRDVPLTGDWDGDGVTDVGVFRPRRQSFRLRDADGSLTAFSFGRVGSVPVTGDWDGDGITDVGVYDRAGSTWTYRAADGTVRTESFGGVNRIPVTGDWNGSGSDRPGTWATSTAWFELQGAPKSSQPRFGRPRG